MTAGCESPGIIWLVPALPSSILEPLWVQVAALLPTRQVHHPLGCHRPRIPDRIVIDKLIQVLVFGCGYRRIADATCSLISRDPTGLAPVRGRSGILAGRRSAQPSMADG
jgi:hypothetical protein